MRKDLIEAYTGIFEDDRDTRERYKNFVSDAGGLATISYEAWLAEEVERLIHQSSPKTRLKHYLQWNGIHGYDESIFAIATGAIR